METKKSNSSVKSKKKSNAELDTAMSKMGKAVKDTFIEMSDSLAGWIDDVSTNFTGNKKPKSKSKKRVKKPMPESCDCSSGANDYSKLEEV